ncbi:MAG TPA: UbiA family prenyltransferase [Candidatus Limnocylindria bacterium]|nr:UbiA family prenyltransferase [Candidatus Limnocylindria bacterium]
MLTIMHESRHELPRPSRVPPLLGLIHPAPAAAVVLLAAALATILSAEGGKVDLARIGLVTLAIAGSQVLTGALNDWADRSRDAATGQSKPIPEGLVSPGAALALAFAGAAVQIGASVPLGGTFLLLGGVAAGSAVAYDLWLSRTPASVIPYLVSFGVLPVWVAAGVDVPVDRVLPAVPLAGIFAAAAHLANTLRDWDADAADGSRSLAQVLGRRRSHLTAVTLTLGVGVGVGLALLAAGRLGPAVAAGGLIGLLAVAAAARHASWLWRAQLVAAVAWTVAWALSTRAG